MQQKILNKNMCFAAEHQDWSSRNILGLKMGFFGFITKYIKKL